MKNKSKERNSAVSSSRIGSYRSRNVIGSITAALILIGTFVLFTQHTHRLTKLLQSSIEIQVLLNNGLSPQDSAAIMELLATQPCVVKKNGKPQIRYVSKEEALQKLSKQLEENILEIARKNPLHNSVMVNILPQYHTKEALQGIKEQLEQEKAIFEVSYQYIAIDQIAKNVRLVGLVTISLAILLIILTIIFVHIAIKLALYSQRFTIRIMQLVGATDYFIKKPFLLRAAGYGFISGVIAVTVLATGLWGLYHASPEFKKAEDWVENAVIFLFLLVVGMLIAVTSAWIAVNKYLHRSLDELYLN